MGETLLLTVLPSVPVRKASNWQQALELFERVWGERVQQHSISYSAAISACEKGEELAAGLWGGSGAVGQIAGCARHKHVSLRLLRGFVRPDKALYGLIRHYMRSRFPRSYVGLRLAL